MFKVEKKN